MSPLPFVEVRLVSLRWCIPFLVGALLASGCKDPSPTTGDLIVSIDGLPSGAIASVRVSGPNQFLQLLSATTTLENLAPGDYVLRMDTVTFSNVRYGVATVFDTIAVVKGRTETKTIPYLVSSGSITFTINGLPAGIGANLRLRGPLPLPNYDSPVYTAGTVALLRPGQYEIESDTMISIQGDRFAAGRTRDTVTVVASLTPAEATVNYTLISGILALTVTGLPNGVSPAPVRITGPGGYDQRTGSSVVLRGLMAGTYTITADNVGNACPNIYTTAQATQSQSVTIGETTSATVTYSQSLPDAANLNLRIDAVHLTQVTQDYDGSVPLISDKQALLRVFGVANQCNTATPGIRVTLSNGSVFTVFNIAAPESSVRMDADQGVLNSSWNVLVPATAIQPGLTVVAEIDSTNAFTEANESDNRFPATGTRAIQVHVAPVVGVRFIPVIQGTLPNSPVGNITAANADAFLDISKKMHPVGTYDYDISLPYTYAGLPLASSGTNWGTLLNEIRALQVAAQTNGESNRYYHGIVKVSYNSGVAGIAYVPGKAGVTWDYLPSGSRVMAHELGHNFGRWHSPCGGPAQIDQNYPSTGFYSGGLVGTYGYDLTTGQIKAANVFTDLMGYCVNQWISDYTYVGMLNWLIDHPTSLPTTASNTAQPSLLVWGRIVDGEPVLEPTFEISARAELPAAAGPHRITATGDDGAELFSLSFTGERIADLPGDNESFAFAVPLSRLRGRTLASLKLTANGRTVNNVASADVAAEPAVTMTRPAARRARVRWDASRFPVVMVRDPVTGDVLSFARGGDVTIVTDRAELDMNFSNRVRSSRRLVPLR